MEKQKSIQAPQEDHKSLVLTPGPQAKPNVLLFTGTENRQSYAQWQESVKNTTPDGKTKTWKEDLDDFLKTYKRKDADAEYIKRTISLPDNFCTQCGDHDVPRGEAVGRNITEFNDTYPAADIVRGDCATGIVCLKCTDAIYNDVEGDLNLKEALDLPRDYFREKRRKKAKQSEEHIIGYITVQRAAGVTGLVLGDDVRRRLYADVE